MRRGLLGLAACAVLVVGCTSSPAPHPVPGPTTPSSPGTATPATTTSSATAENPALYRCDDLKILPCARQVNRISLPIAGSAITLDYASDRQPGRTADPAPGAADVGLGGWSLSVLPGYDPTTHREVLPDGTLRTVTGVAQGDLTAIADPAGATVTTFDTKGRAQATASTLTGAPILTFAWTDAGLSSVTDAAGARLIVGRGSDGNPTSLQADGTSPMTLKVADGNLTGIGYPDGGTVAPQPGVKGLLSAIIDQSDLRTSFGYDETGRLISRTAPTGITTDYTRRASDSTTTVTTSIAGATLGTDAVTASGATLTFSHTDGAGVITSVTAGGTGRTISSGTIKATLDMTPDPKWGADAAIPSTITVNDGDRRTSASATGSPASRTVTLAGQTWKLGYDATSRASSITGPSGTTRQTTLNPAGGVESTTVQGIPVKYGYDKLGRVTTITIGTGDAARTWSYHYETGSITVTNPLGQTTEQLLDAAGRAFAQAGPLGTGFATSVDTAGHITSFAAAGAGSYAVTWGANGHVAAVNAPAGPGGPQFTAIGYDQAGRPTSVTTGDSTLTIGRDQAGRVISLGPDKSPDVTMSYNDSGALDAATSPHTTLTQSYTGTALTGSVTKVGDTSAQITRTVDDIGRTTTLAVNGGTPTKYSYDPAGRVIAAGSMTISRDPATGWITGRTLGALTETISYNQFGEPTKVVVTGPKGIVAAIETARDALGRITSRTTTTGKARSTIGYGYDAAGRLSTETADGATTSYTYDPAGNLTTVTTTGATVNNSYDSRNALLRSGSTTYGYDSAGRLATATGPAGTTTYRYDSRGNLTGVDAPDGTSSTYAIDPFGRRVSTGSGRDAGTIVYLDSVRPAAKIGPDGSVQENYVYDGDLAATEIDNGGGTLPAYLTKSGTDYLEVPDSSGGPAMVIDSTSGAIVATTDRTAFGLVRSQTGAGFQLFGFAGGLADPATNLVRIGARDYDTGSGRWIEPDPLGIASGSANLYNYVSGDPVNRIDPMGTCDYVGVGISAGVGLGPVAGGGGIGVAWAGGQFGTYSTFSNGVGAVGELGFGVTVTCLDSDNGDRSLGNFSGGAASVDGSAGPVAGGSDVGYDNNGNQSSHGSHGTVNFGSGFGGSYQRSITSIVCLLGCPPPGPTVCGDLGCSSAPGNSPADPGDGAGGGGLPTSGPRSTGDPHIRTATNTYYDMMAVGEFVWSTTDTKSVTVQVRQQPLPHSRTASINTAIAMSVNGNRINLTPPPGPGLPIALTVTGADVPGYGTFSLPGGVGVMRSPALTTITAADGTKLWIRNNPSGLDIVAAFPDSLHGKVHGLVGPFTAEPSGTVETASGTSLTVAQLHDYDTLYRTFADSWRVSQATSLFTDRPGTDATAFNDPTFPDRTVPGPPAKDLAVAKAACAAMGLAGAELDACIFDVATTGNAGFAQSAAAMSGVIPGAAPVTTTGTVTGAIVPGKSASGTVAAGAQTTVEFTVSAATVGYFAADPTCNDKNSADLTWSIRDASDASIGSPSLICADLGRIVLPAAGKYRIVVSNMGSTTAPFTVLWKQSRPDIVRPLQADQPATGRIELPGARDIWTIDATAGSVAYLATNSKCPNSSELAILWNVAGPDGATILPSSYQCSDLGRIVIPTTGTYRITLTGDADRTASYSITWVTSRADVSKPLQRGQSANGTIDRPGAQDLWEMTVNAGEVAYLAAAPNCSDPGTNPLLWTVLRPDGSPLVGTSLMCSDLGRIVFPAAGSYRIRVSGSASRTGPYSVRWEVSRPDKAQPLQPGQTVTGTIDKPGSQDAWAMTVSGRTVVQLTADPGCNSATSTNLTWVVLGPDNSPIVGSSFICSDLGSVTLPAAGTYRVQISSNAGATGSYSFRRS